MTLSTTQVTGSFIDPTSGQPLSNVNVTFQVSQVLYVSGIPVVAPASPIAAEVSGGQLLAASGGPLELLDQGNSVSLGTGTGFWWWTVELSGDITDSWDFQLPHSASAIDLWSTKNTGTAAAGSFLAASTGSSSVPAADLAPKVIALTDGASIAVNAALGNDYYVTLAGNRTMAAPTNPSDRQRIAFEITQDSAGSRTLTWTGGAGGYSFGSGSAPTLSTAAGAADQVAFAYSARKGQWLFLGADGGF